MITLIYFKLLIVINYKYFLAIEYGKNFPTEWVLRVIKKPLQRYELQGLLVVGVTILSIRLAAART